MHDLYDIDFGGLHPAIPNLPIKAPLKNNNTCFFDNSAVSTATTPEAKTPKKNKTKTKDTPTGGFWKTRNHLLRLLGVSPKASLPFFATGGSGPCRVHPGAPCAEAPLRREGLARLWQKGRSRRRVADFSGFTSRI